MFQRKDDKLMRSRTAKEHVMKCHNMYFNEIMSSIDRSRIFYDNGMGFVVDGKTGDVPAVQQSMGYAPSNVLFYKGDTASCLYEMNKSVHNGKIMVLNFASWYSPGGRYLNGDIAQEEALCSQSFLYNVLSSTPIVRMYYSRHDGVETNGVFNHDCIYSPDILFFYNDCNIFADVLTIAAPDFRPFLKMGGNNVSLRYQLCKVRHDRVKVMLSVAKYCGIKNIILGAWGCGVFKNSVIEVSQEFRGYLTNEFVSDFDIVAFAIPHSSSHKFEKFRSVWM